MSSFSPGKPFVSSIAVHSNLCTALHRDFSDAEYFALFDRFLSFQAGLFGVSLLMAASFVSIRTSACGVSFTMFRKGPSFCLSNPAFIALSPGLGIAKSWLRMRALTFRA